MHCVVFVLILKINYQKMTAIVLTSQHKPLKIFMGDIYNTNKIQISVFAVCSANE